MSFNSQSPFHSGSTANVDALLHDVSNHMARAQLARQISASSSMNTRRRAARVLKTNSTGSSPQKVQRRRTTAAHKSMKHPLEIYATGAQTQQVGGLSAAELWPGVSVRPVSWHPTSFNPNPRSSHTSYNDTSATCSIPRYQTVDINGLPTPRTEPDSDHGVHVDPSFTLDGSSGMYYPHTMSYAGYPSFDGNGHPSYQATQVDDLDHSHFSGLPMSHDFPVQSTMDDWTQACNSSLDAVTSMTAPPTPDFLPIQQPVQPVQNIRTNAKQPRRKRSKELVAMGLYDSPDDEFSPIATTGYHSFQDMNQPIGKGLKLEETWEPPEEEEDSIEDSEQGEKQSLGELEAQHATQSQGITNQSTAYPGFGDLSNQTFFFDGDDGRYDDAPFDEQMQQLSDLAPKVLAQGFESFTWI
ncbi:hypothetical protein MMC09_003228 [Bachmanniomyces sp. S44760]|nr:hypothetical protein [Bachmanniomyces sp. S44760]